jgi:hypothetical protein
MADVDNQEVQAVSPIAGAVGAEVQIVPTEAAQSGAYRPNMELVNELPNTETVPLYSMESQKCCGCYKWTVDFYPTCLVMFRQRKDGQGKITVMPKYQVVGYECRTKTFPKWIAAIVPLLVWALIFIFHPVNGKNGWLGDCPTKECEEGAVADAEETCDKYDTPWTFSSPKEMVEYTTTQPPPTPWPTAAPITPEPTLEPPTPAPTSLPYTASPTASPTPERVAQVFTQPACGPGSSEDGHAQIYKCCVEDYGPGTWIALQVVFLVLLGVPVIAWFFIRTPPDWCHVRLNLRNAGLWSWFFSESWSSPMWLSKEPDHAFLRQYIYGSLQPKIEEYHALNHLKRNKIRVLASAVGSSQRLQFPERVPVVQVAQEI